MAADKRKHPRFHHIDNVELASESDTFFAMSVDLSKSGMQVVVKMPATYDSIQSVAFQIPGSGEKVLLPCRLIRNGDREKSGDQALGIEFLSDDDAQLFLIEKFIEDGQLRRNEERQLPRTSCHLEDVVAANKKMEVLSIDNLSTEGLLLNYRGSLQHGDALEMSLGIPGDKRRLRLSGTVMYVLDNVFRGCMTAGLRLGRLKEIEERRLRNLIVTCASASAMRELHEQLSAKITESEYRLSRPDLVESVFESLFMECVPLNTIVDGSYTVLESTIALLDRKERQFAIKSKPEYLENVRNGEAAYSSFFWNKGGHYFKAKVLSKGDGLMKFALPSVLFRSNKRSYQRKPLVGSTVDLVVNNGKTDGKVLKGTLLDISRRGFLCAVDVSRDLQNLFVIGKSVRYVVDKRLGLGNEGQIRHVRVQPDGGRPIVQVGIEACIGRTAVHYWRIGENQWKEQTAQESRVIASGKRIDSVLVHFKDKAGKEICGLVNSTEQRTKGPVVIIPSAYGKTKESLSPLVATLLETFWSQNKSLVTLRYDGIDRPGESFQSNALRKPGYEMLSYRLSQGLSDLEAAVEFARENAYFSAESMIIVSFSMSAIEARRLLSKGNAAKVDYWISCMGVPCAQTTLRNILGGIDIVSNYRLGIPNGIVGLLGHLIDMDSLATDLVNQKYAFMTDARFDMSQIDVPLMWIYGLNDKWVEIDEIKDLMSVKARASRELVEIPTGHNLRTSDDAIDTFKLIASSIYQKLHGTKGMGRKPSKEQVLSLLTAERERLENRAEPELNEYWRGYLLGSESNKSGYDFYRNIPEFIEFVRLQIDCLEFGKDEIVADLGCGTGIVLEEILNYMAKEEETVSIKEITAVDLVQEALEKTRNKCESVIKLNHRLRLIRLNYVQKNLEPNRLQPMAEYIAAESASLERLRNKVNGLSSKVLDELIAKESPDLKAVIRGAIPDKDIVRALKEALEPETFQVLTELGRAARYLGDCIAESDIRRDCREKRIPAGALRTSDLVFERLNFGDYGRELSTGFSKNYFTRIVASLFVSYLANPEYFLRECYGMLRPGGRIVVSSMRPDSDISVIFTDYIRNAQRDCHEQGSESETEGVKGARDMLNEAASLFELEEAGHFRFYACEELEELLADAGFVEITVLSGMGKPAQANIATARKGGM